MKYYKEIYYKKAASLHRTVQSKQSERLPIYHSPNPRSLCRKNTPGAEEILTLLGVLQF